MVHPKHPPVGGSPAPKPFAYTFRLAQYRVTDTRSLHEDSNTVGYTLNIGGQSYTQTLPPVDVGNGNHDVCLEFPNMHVSDPSTVITLAYAIANAGHDADKVEAEFQKGVDQVITAGAKKVLDGDGHGGGAGGGAAGTAAAGAAAAAAGGATFGTALVVAGAIFVVNEVLNLIFADCDGTVAADKMATPLSSIAALIPKSSCVFTGTAHYPGTESADGCGGNSSYYVTHTITRTQVGDTNQPESGKLFVIAGRSSGLVLDVPGGSDTEGLQIQQWQDNGTASQHWELQPIDDGYFLIRSSLNGLVLEVAGSSNADHAKIQQATESGGENQHWRFEEASVPPPQVELPVLGPLNSYYMIRSRSSNKVLDVPSQSAHAGTKIQQYGAKTSDYNNQLWQLLQLPEVPEGPPVAHS